MKNLNPLTLAVTSSTGAMGIALGRDGSDAVEVEVLTDRRHAEEMSPRLQQVLDQAGMKLADVERLAIDIGPGRFTGLRVGLATVRALSFALDVPAVGLTSLAVLAAGVVIDPVPGVDPADPVTAVIDARRAEVFQQRFLAGRPMTEPTVGSPEELALEAGGLVIGDGADRYADHYRQSDSPDQAQRPSPLTVVSGRNPRAAAMLVLAGPEPGVPGTDIKPLYLREPDAKPNIKTRPAGNQAVGS